MVIGPLDFGIFLLQVNTVTLICFSVFPMFAVAAHPNPCAIFLPASLAVS